MQARLKPRVLELFAIHQRLLTPDDVWVGLRRNLQRTTVYSYLSRLCRQGLVERASCRPIAYRITPKGIERLRFFQSKRV
jgi:Fe2+ or Zn2+ uptake regulation protein